MTANRMQAGDALVIVDVQNDFCPGGALPIAEGDRVVPVLNEWIEIARAAGAPIYASRDWHPEEHISFKESGGPWPPHCVQDTEGAAFRSDLNLPENTIKVTKGTRFDRDQNSVFDGTGVEHHLRKRGIRHLYVGGLAQDVCVLATVLDARKLGFEVTVIPDGTRGVTPEGSAAAVEQMREAGATFTS